jgi:hypothetical protein
VAQASENPARRRDLEELAGKLLHKP